MPYYQSRRTGNNGRPQSSSYNRSSSRGRMPRKAYIDPAKFVKSAKPSTDTLYTPIHKFSDFKLNNIIQNNLKSLGYSEPSPIQDQTIPAGIEGKDIVGIANTGTGKTAAFAVPLINKLILERDSQAIILAPTRELAQQIEEQCRKIAQGSGLFSVILIGGVAMGPQLRDLRRRPRLIIGTPGRIKDHIERRSLSLANCNVVVLDEVDRMLDMGFVNDITFVINQTNKVRQSFYFSATLDSRVKSIIDTFSKDPVLISVKSGETSDNIEQNIVSFSHGEKIGKLHDILIQDSTVKALVFDDTHRSVEKLATELEARGFSADSIHGGKSQSQRQRVLRRFKDSQIKVLVATDVAARGLDVSDITHVINYSSPQSYDDYVHRIGRTGRAGKVGHALTFVER
jgi:superfamily II DNA/RNA helicase